VVALPWERDAHHRGHRGHIEEERDWGGLDSGIHLGALGALGGEKRGSIFYHEGHEDHEGIHL
ncbi:MAG TPA: hypothetical protein P5525_11930, partial [Candidatus Paceibacterota bacterium]|nr:hypothetical protein [Candidatus Paceibacterota bacterium]